MSILYRAWKTDKKRARQLLRWLFRAELTLLGEAFQEIWGTASINTCFFFVIQRSSYTSLSAPYAVLLFVANVTSLISVGSKIRWLVRKIRSRHMKHATARPNLINEVRATGHRLEMRHVVELEKIARVWENLREKDDLQQIDRDRLVAYVVLALAQEYALISICLRVVAHSKPAVLPYWLSFPARAPLLALLAPEFAVLPAVSSFRP
jgi:hypothetical protein